MTGFDSKRSAAADKLQEPEREALKLAVNGLEKILHTFVKDGKVVMSSMIRNELFAEVNSLLQQTKAALAQPAQEPDYWLGYGLQAHTEKPFENATALFTTPPKRPWVGLTDEEMYLNCPNWLSQDQCKKWLQQIEAKLKEKNNG